MNHSEELYKTFMDLITMEKNLEDIVSTTGIFVDNVAYWDKTTGNIYIDSRSKNFSYQIKNMAIHELISIYPHSVVENRGEVYGYLFYYRPEEGDFLEEEALKLSIAALKLATNRKKGWLNDEQKRRENILQALLASNITSLNRRIKRGTRLERTLKGPLVPVVIDNDRNEKGNYFIEGWLRSKFPDSLQGYFADDIVALVPIKGELKSWREFIRKSMEELLSTMTVEEDRKPFIGVGSIVDNLKSCPEGYRQAKEAIKIAKEQARYSRCFLWDESELYSLLRAIPQKEALYFIEQKLALLDKDDVDIQRTLRTLSKTGWNLKRAAQDLNIHYNTIRYRYNQIKERLNFSQEDDEAKLSLTIALLLREIYGDSN